VLIGGPKRAFPLLRTDNASHHGGVEEGDHGGGRLKNGFLENHPESEGGVSNEMIKYLIAGF